MKVLIYTSVFGDYDPPQDHADQNIETYFMRFSQPHEELGDNPRMQSKYYKLLLHRVLGVENAFDYTIWVDGSIKIISPDFAKYMVSQAKHSWAMFTHAWHDCIYDETLEAHDMKKYAHLPMMEQMAHYKDQGMPRHYGMTTATIICRNTKNMSVIGYDELWWRELLYWGEKDQVALQYVMWKSGGKINHCDKPLLNNGLFTIHAGHRAKEYQKLKPSSSPQ